MLSRDFSKEYMQLIYQENLKLTQSVNTRLPGFISNVNPAIALTKSASEPNKRWVIITSRGKRGSRHSLRGCEVNIQYGNIQIPCRLCGTPVLHLETKFNILTNYSIPVHSCIAGSDLDP